MASKLPTRKQFQPYLAEFLGTFLLILLGESALAQTLLSHNTYGSYLTVNLAFAVGLSLSSLLSFPSPDVNPAVTLTLALLRPSRTSARTIALKLLSQFLGAFVGAAAVYLTYRSAIASFDPQYSVPGTSIINTHASAGIFATYPSALYNSNWEAAWSEGLGSAVLMFGVLAIADPVAQRRFAGPHVSLFLLLLGIGASLGWQTGYVSFLPFPLLDE